MASPMCFLCACTFPWVESRRGNQIAWEHPFKAAVGDRTLVIRFGDWTMTEVQARFSVDAYLRDYRREPGNSALDLEEAWFREDFTDWLATVSTPCGKVRILCCPEDQRCHRGCQEKGT
eukprot:1801211-Pyramimonas_sp.AAC.1